MDFEDDAIEQINRDKEPRFNSALDTLERISLLLKRNSLLHVVYTGDLTSRQREKIDLLINFFITIIPILDVDIMQKYREEILDMQMQKTTMVKNGIQKVGEIYSPKLEKRLNELFIILQISIRQYFMPQGDGDDWDI